MKEIKLKYSNEYIIYHIIERFLGGNLLNNEGITTFNNKNDNWKLFFKYKYNFLNYGDKYLNRTQIEKDNEEIERYIYRDLEGQELIDMIDFLYDEIFSLEILPGDPKYFGEDYWGNNTELFHSIVSQIDYRKLKISEIDQLKDIITKNYKKSKVTEDTYNEVLRELERKKVTAIKENK